MTRILEKIRDWIGLSRNQTCPRGVHARFALTYDRVLVGFLDACDGEWVFRYSDEFRNQKALRPITEFPETGKIYRSRELWPFFLLRIPSPKQSAVRAIIEKEHIDTSDDVQLLRRFGRHAVFSPFELAPESEERQEAAVAH